MIVENILTPHEKQLKIRSLIYALYEDKSSVEIKNKLEKSGVPLQIRRVQQLVNLCKKLEDDSDLFLYPKGHKDNQRPNKLSYKEKLKFLVLAEKHRDWSVRELINAIYIHQKTVSKQTVGRLLQKRGLKSRVKKRTFALNKKQISDRNIWAEEYAKKGPNFWKKVWFSDESMIFAQYRGRQYVRKYDGESWDDPRFLKEQKPFHGGLQVMVFGIISQNGPRYLKLVEGKLNSDRYCDILKEYLVENQEFDENEQIFQQDEARIHTAKKTIEYLKASGMQPLCWFTKGCDISPIEQVWAEVKHHVFENKHQIKTKKDLFQMAQNFFHSDYVTKFINKLYKSMPERVRRLKQAKGGRQELLKK